MVPTAVMNVVGGLVLCVGIIGALPVVGESLEKSPSSLAAFR